MTYAYWRKCDFQIHSPRDPNWKGSRHLGSDSAPVQSVDVERKIWAEHFVDQCVAKGLQAIALTDHHEMIMVPYVQSEIRARSINDSTFDLWLFPGMELTAKGGKQCIIIFDSDLPEEWWKQAQAKLGIKIAELNETDLVATKVKQLACRYPDIASSLDEIDGLRGRYIVLPNVSQSNSHTVLTTGAHADFLSMPYVGGYLDRNQTIHTLSRKNRTRLSGKDRTWSVRSIYPLPTSDSRSADFESLGTNETWIKIAEPTAEAIRQAFLGHRSRIRIEPPKLPSFVLTKVEVNGSTILETTTLPLSPEFNAVIGGRGSGKSTFLEYVAFALGRSCDDIPREHYSGTRRMRQLLNESLTSTQGQVAVEVQMDNAKIRIVRGPKHQYHPQVTYENAATQTVGVTELRQLFPAVVYSQGELADLGRKGAERTRLSDLLQFVDPEYKQIDNKFTMELKAAKDTVRSEIQAVVSSWSLQARMRQLENRKNALRQRFDALEKTLPTDSEANQAALDHFNQVSEFNMKLAQVFKQANHIVFEIKRIGQEVGAEHDLSTELKGTAEVVRSNYRNLYRTFDSGISRLRENLSAKLALLRGSKVEWQEEYKKAESRQNEVLKSLGNQQIIAKQLISIRNEIADVTNQIGKLRDEERIQGEPSERLEKALGIFRKINNERDQRTGEWAETIESLSSRKIRASVTFGADTEEIRDAVETIAAKTFSRETTRKNALDGLLKPTTAAEFAEKLCVECLQLLQWRDMGDARGDTRPKCKLLRRVLGGTDLIQNTVKVRMDVARIEAIATAVAKPRIDLHYFDGDRRIAFEKASDGQRAAALLFMLLEQTGGTLIVDQPEGDLDNRIITELTDKLHEAKEKRQLIFASHNANLVVNGSAELVGHLDVNSSGKRLFKCTGAIDRPEVCNVITSTMEGGEKAFKDRQDKYGY